MAAWLVALAAIALIVGIVLPTATPRSSHAGTLRRPVAASTVTTPQK